MTYSSLDGSSNSADIKAFQKWVWYVKADKSLKTTKAPDGVDGIWGGKTSGAWNKYSAEYAKYLAPAPEITTPITTVTSETIVEEKPKDETDTTKQGWWAKKTKTQKGLIIGGGIALIAVVGFVIYKVRKNKN